MLAPVKSLLRRMCRVTWTERHRTQAMVWVTDDRCLQLREEVEGTE